MYNVFSTVSVQENDLPQTPQDASMTTPETDILKLMSPSSC